MTGWDGALGGMAALVTGGSGGIGKACARWLLKDGASVTLMGRGEDALKDAVASLEEEAPAGATVGYVVGDAEQAEDVERAVSAATQPTGALNICVATVGGSTIAPLLATGELQFMDDMRRNALTAFLAIKHSTPAIAAAGGGSIVCISSDAASMAWQFMPGYCAGKAALEGLVRAAADELGHLGVRVNAVRPGLVKVGTERHSGIFDNPEILKMFVEQKPLGRTGVPDDIGAGVRYLAGPEAAWVTGQCLAIEGGNELRAAPRLEAIARQRCGDWQVDESLAGRIPR